MEIKFRVQLITILIVAFFFCLTGVLEAPLVAEVERLPMLAIKFGLALGLALFSLFRMKFGMREGVFRIAIGVIFALYSFASNAYRPLYMISLFQLTYLYIFIFDLSPKFFWIYLGTTFIAFAAFFNGLWPDVVDANVKLELADYNNMLIQLAAMLIMTYLFFVRSRRYREFAEARFALIGKQAARVTHDVKGMLTAPKIYLQHIEQKIEGNEQLKSEVKEMLTMTQHHLEDIQRAITELSRLSSPDSLPETHFSFADSLRSTEIMLKNKLHGVQLLIEGDIKILADRSLISSIVFNLMTNSLNAIQRIGGGDHFIRWRIDPNERSICCEDSGGGFSALALSSLMSGEAITEFKDGSGLGLQIVRNAAAALGAYVSFENGERGARVVLSLPAKILSQH